MADSPARVHDSRVPIDTRRLVAILNASDSRHDECARQLRVLRSPLLTCWPVITEAAWMLRAYPQAIRSLMLSLDRSVLELCPLDESDAALVSGILAKYQTLALQLADPALVHIAGREGIETIFTLDRPDFGVLRGVRGRKFRLIP